MSRQTHRKPTLGFWRGSCTGCGKSITNRTSYAVHPQTKEEKAKFAGGQKLPRICFDCEAKATAPVAS